MNRSEQEEEGEGKTCSTCNQNVLRRCINRLTYLCRDFKSVQGGQGGNEEEDEGRNESRRARKGEQSVTSMQYTICSCCGGT
mmetsp:Transcript_14500/g.29189  ORF Transcript_14500/g.29189 Transcript_14500/m.29189 type:complete len:82 (-) Transcript_14500:1019-1264(-)